MLAEPGHSVVVEHGVSDAFAQVAAARSRAVRRTAPRRRAVGASATFGVVAGRQLARRRPASCLQRAAGRSSLGHLLQHGEPCGGVGEEFELRVGDRVPPTELPAGDRHHRRGTSLRGGALHGSGSTLRRMFPRAPRPARGAPYGYHARRWDPTTDVWFHAHVPAPPPGWLEAVMTDLAEPTRPRAERPRRALARRRAVLAGSARRSRLPSRAASMGERFHHRHARRRRAAMGTRWRWQQG